MKIKLNITCVSIECEVKTKMVQEQWLQLKMKFLLGYLTWKLSFSVCVCGGGGGGLAFGGVG